MKEIFTNATRDASSCSLVWNYNTNNSSPSMNKDFQCLQIMKTSKSLRLHVTNKNKDSNKTVENMDEYPRARGMASWLPST